MGLPFLVTSIAILSISCATMFNSGSQTIRAIPTENVEGVPVIITTPDGSYESNLPTTIVASPSTFTNVTIEVKDSQCYESRTVKVRSSITPSFWANILIYPGFLIDPFTGAMWKYDNTVSVPLTMKSTCKVQATH
jgi:hypothetical protein